MPTPTDLAAWSDAGAFVLFLALLLVVGIGLQRQWWVPGSQYRDLERREAKAQAELDAKDKTIARLTLQLTRERRRRGTDSDDA